MSALKTTVVMKTDICGSTPRFRAMLAADINALIGAHREFVSRHAAAAAGRIVKAAGDGFWLEFGSVTDAARAAIAMQEDLHLAQPTRGDERLSMRIAISLGDLSTQDGELIGDAMALAARIEAITPPDEIYLSLAARLAVNQAEVSTTLVDDFALKGFAEPVRVYRVRQRHRTRVVADGYILFCDLRGFGRIMQAEAVDAVERVLDALEQAVRTVAQEFDGAVRFNTGDAYCATFGNAERAISAAQRLAEVWDGMSRRDRQDCAIVTALHRGPFNAFRSFLYGPGVHIASQLQAAASRALPPGEGGVFATGAVRSALQGSPWSDRLHPFEAPLARPHPEPIEVFRLRDAPPA